MCVVDGDEREMDEHLHAQEEEELRACVGGRGAGALR